MTGLTAPSLRAYNSISVRYYQVKNDHYVSNGKSVLRVGPVLTLPDPVLTGRTVRVVQVLQVLRDAPHNPAPARGSMIALTFPNESLWSKSYTWKHNEPAQMPFEILDKKVNVEAWNQEAKEIRKANPDIPQTN